MKRQLAAIRSRDLACLEAVRNGDVTKMQRLFQQHNLNADDPDCRDILKYALEQALENDHADLVRHLLSKGVSSCFGPAFWYDSVRAAAEERQETLKALLDYECEPNTRDKALRAACSAGQLDAAVILLQYGGDILARANSTDSLDALECASRAGHLTLAEMLYNHGVTEYGDSFPSESTLAGALVASSGRGNLEVMSFWLSKGASVHKQNAYGSSALLEAVRNGSLDALDFLVAHGASTSQRFEEGRSLLMIAVENHRIAIVQRLLKFRADVSCQSFWGSTALHAACSTSLQSGDQVIIQILLQHSADPNALTYWKKSPLIVLLETKYQPEDILGEVIRLLVDAGADVNFQNIFGQAALGCACVRGYTGCVQLLLDHGANRHYTDRDGKLACFRELRDLDWSEKHLECLKILLLHGTAFDRDSWEFQRAVELAREGSFETALELLGHQEAMNASLSEAPSAFR